jgi:hypothetical protein
MEQRVEEYIAKETVRLGIRISSRQSTEARLQQLMRHSVGPSATEKEVTVLATLVQMRLQRQASEQPRMVTRSMVKRG